MRTLVRSVGRKDIGGEYIKIDYWVLGTLDYRSIEYSTNLNDSSVEINWKQLSSS